VSNVSPPWAAPAVADEASPIRSESLICCDPRAVTIALSREESAEDHAQNQQSESLRYCSGKSSGHTGHGSAVGKKSMSWHTLGP
jgi:hypothetical protein